MRKLVGYALVVAWTAYIGVTGYVVWRLIAGDTPDFLSSYTIGTNALWIVIGFMLWLATQWSRGFDSRY